jgi:hypothetical protein
MTADHNFAARVLREGPEGSQEIAPYLQAAKVSLWNRKHRYAVTVTSAAIKCFIIGCDGLCTAGLLYVMFNARSDAVCHNLRRYFGAFSRH